MSIKIENTEVMGWEAAIRGMRNPLLSHDRSDSFFGKALPGNKLCWVDIFGNELPPCTFAEEVHEDNKTGLLYNIGPNDHDLMMRLAKAGTEHAKYRRMIVVYADITAPLYLLKELDTYQIGKVQNSCSTMHKIHAKEFTIDDFSCEHLNKNSLRTLEYVLEDLNHWRSIYINGGMDDNYDGTSTVYEPKDKNAWWQMIQLLPSSYNQKRTVMLNYEVLANIYRQRKGHKLDEWKTFREWIESLPYSEIITLKESEDEPCT